MQWNHSFLVFTNLINGLRSIRNKNATAKINKTPDYDTLWHLLSYWSIGLFRLFNTEQVSPQQISRISNKTENQFIISKDSKKNMLQWNAHNLEQFQSTNHPHFISPQFVTLFTSWISSKMIEQRHLQVLCHF